MIKSIKQYLSLRGLLVKIKKQFIQQFSIAISQEQANKWGLEFDINIYGDQINYWNCRSLWRDKKRNIYRVRELNHSNN